MFDEFFRGRDSLFISPDFFVKRKRFVEMRARLREVALKTARVAEQGLRCDSFEFFMRRCDCGWTAIDDLHRQFAWRRDLRLDPLGVPSRVEVALHQRIDVVPRKLNQRRARLIELTNRELPKIRLNVNAFILEGLHPLLK